MESGNSAHFRILPGFELLRVAGSFGVVLCHVLGTRQWAGSDWMLQMRVPVFLLMALYLSSARWLDSRNPRALSDRLQRLVIPLMAWGIFECLFYRLWNVLAGHPEIALRPVNVTAVLLGSADHRYFLTWLVIGTALVYVLTSLIAALKFRGAAIVVALGSIVSFVPLTIFAGGHAHPGFINWYNESPDVFEGLGSYVVCSLPYAGLAILFCLATQWRIGPKTGLLLVLTGLTLNHFAGAWYRSSAAMTGMSGSSMLLVGACGAVLFGLALPAVKLPTIIRNASSCAYGIYLSHMLVFFLVGKIAKRFGIFPDSLATLLGMFVVTFFGSWALSLALHQVPLTRWLFLGARAEVRVADPVIRTSTASIPTLAAA